MVRAGNAGMVYVRRGIDRPVCVVLREPGVLSRGTLGAYLDTF
jgi:hypothetical protein